MGLKYDELRQAIYPILKTAVPALTRSYDSPEAEKVSWRDLVQKYQEGTGTINEQLKPPWAAMDFGAEMNTDGEYGLVTDYKTVPVRIFLIYDWDNAGTRRTVDEQFELAYGDAEEVKDAIWKAKGVDFGMVARPTIDGSINNDPNSYFLDIRVDLFGVEVLCECLIGGELVDGTVRDDTFNLIPTGLAHGNAVGLAVVANV